VRTRNNTELALGMAAGPLFVVIGLAQAFTRDGFDLRRDTLSLLSNGDLGWIQVLNFILSGLLYVAGALGMRRALPTGRASTWGPRLLGAFGVGMIGSGVFRPDPGFGFPPGAPAGAPATTSWHSGLHYTIASLTLVALVVATVAISSAQGKPPVNVLFVTTALLSFLWASVLAGHLRAQALRVAADTLV
jgi:hypothetical protein